MMEWCWSSEQSFFWILAAAAQPSAWIVLLYTDMPSETDDYYILLMQDLASAVCDLLGSPTIESSSRESPLAVAIVHCLGTMGTNPPSEEMRRKLMLMASLYPSHHGCDDVPFRCCVLPLLACCVYILV